MKLIWSMQNTKLTFYVIVLDPSLRTGLQLFEELYDDRQFLSIFVVSKAVVGKDIQQGN